MSRLNARILVLLIFLSAVWPAFSHFTTPWTNWMAQLELKPGSHQLIASAIHPSGLYANSVTNTFVNDITNHTADTYNADGELTSRMWLNSSGKTNGTQSFSWDARKRLHAVTFLDTNYNGYTFSAVYDGIGRRIQSTTILITNNVSLTNQSKVVSQYYDPAVKFLELGETDNNVTNWKIYGPDANGAYGGLNGVGGLDAIAPGGLGLVGPQALNPVVSDFRGNGYGMFSTANNTLAWYASRLTAYGAVPGYRPPPLTLGSLGASSAYLGKYPDVTEFYQFGERGYNPISGCWNSHDSIWDPRNPNGFTYCGGDSINGVDPDGRCVEGANTGGYSQIQQGAMGNYASQTGNDSTQNGFYVHNGQWGMQYNGVFYPSGSSTYNGGGGMDYHSMFTSEAIGTSSESNPYESASTALGIGGIAQFGGEFGSGTAAIGSNFRFYSGGFYGNQYASVTRISSIAKRAAPPLAAFSIYADYRNPDISTGQFTANTTATGIGFLGPVGAAFSVGYSAGSLIEVPINYGVKNTFQTFTDIYYNAPDQ